MGFNSAFKGLITKMPVCGGWVFECPASMAQSALNHMA